MLRIDITPCKVFKLQQDKLKLFKLQDILNQKGISIVYFKDNSNNKFIYISQDYNYKSIIPFLSNKKKINIFKLSQVDSIIIDTLESYIDLIIKRKSK